MIGDWNMDLHTGASEAQFGHLPLVDDVDEEEKGDQFVQHPRYQKPGSSHSDSSEDESDDNSDAAPKRWEQPSSLEMDCIFLEDESTKEENALPQIFDVETV